MICPACNANVSEGIICGSCGANLPRRRTFTMLLSCRHCGGSLPWQGPLRAVRCAACQGNNPLAAKKVATMLHGQARARQKERLRQPPCASCGAPLDLQAILSGQDSSVSCAQCGSALIAYPPPAWLQHELPALELIVGGERDTADYPADSEPVVVPRVSGPVALACPSCQAGLTVDSDSARTISCEFCNTSVYLPDDLWRVLHPVKQAQPWTIVFRGELEFRRHIEARELKAAEALARSERELAKRAEAARRKRVYRAKAAQEQAAAHQEELAADKRRTRGARTVAAVIMVLALVLSGVYLGWKLWRAF